MTDEFPRLKNPPITEVVCGFTFAPFPGLTILDIGTYAELRLKEFPKRELHHGLIDGGMMLLPMGAPPLRAWLISEDESLLIQLQPDRLYMNWRARGPVYPRFSDHGDEVGLQTLALKELDRYCQWAAQRTGAEAVQLRTVELTKIDVLRRGTHWDTFSDLATVLKVARVFGNVQATDPQSLELRFRERTTLGELHTSISVGDTAAKLESRLYMKADRPPAQLLHDANSRLNEVFFGLIEPDALPRFGD